MPPEVKDLFTMLGVITAGMFCFLVLYTIYTAIKEGISKAKWKYLYKHRFDKPPIAECYCKDCKKHDFKTNRCYKFEGVYTADNWFCWDAEPKENLCP